MGSVEKSIHHSIGDGGLSDVFVPIPERELACDDNRTCSVAVLDDLEQVLTLVIIQRLDSKVIEDERFYSGESSEMFEVSARASRSIKILQKPRSPLIKRGIILAASPLPER